MCVSLVEWIHLGTNSRVQSGSTALICAAASGRMDSARLLLNAGADTEAQSNVRGRSAASVVAHAICFIKRSLSLGLVTRSLDARR